MEQIILLSKTKTQLREIFFSEFPELCEAAKKSNTCDLFKDKVRDLISDEFSDLSVAIDQLKELFDYDGQTVYELSNHSAIQISTIEHLYHFLRGNLKADVSSDLFVDLFFQFKRLYQDKQELPTKKCAEDWMERWPSGVDEDIWAERILNKDRLINLLVEELSGKKKQNSNYYLSKDLSFDEKYIKVQEWWNDYKFQLSMAARTPDRIKEYLGNAISTETYHLMLWAKEKGMPFFLTPYYASLINTKQNGFDDLTLRTSVLYSPELVKSFGSIRSWEGEDVIKAGEPNNAGWIVPNDFNVHRRYPEVALLIPDTMGRACGGLCSYCQRMYDFQNKGLNFELKKLVPEESWNEKLKGLMKYFEEDSQIRDILLSGGDFLMSQNSSLRHILSEVLNMAERKRKNNQKRKDGEKYAEIQRVRIGTRLPVYLPMRFNDELIEILKEFRIKGSEIGIKQFVIQTHFQTPLEFTPEVIAAIKRVQSTGWIITNQLVFNVAESRRGHTAKLRQVLSQNGIACYYTFSVKGYEENQAVFTPIARSVQEAEEEKRFGRLSSVNARILSEEITETHSSEPIKEALQKYNIPFLASDRNVLNLPAIGKSISFKLVGIDEKGRRILRFDHDRSRTHSPIIDRMGDVFIIENKSICEYLRQLYEYGEDVEAYSSIWNYTKGTTEPRFPLFKYPQFAYQKTQFMTNLKL